MVQNQTLERVKEVKTRHEEELLKLPNVVGVGIGFIYKKGQPTDNIGIVVSVTAKKGLAGLAEPDRIPTELEGVPVDVQEVAQIRAL
jgi:hypothetical protein